MLNHEGWCLLLILCAVIALLLLALPHMRAEKTVSQRLSAGGCWAWLSAGVVLRACGALVLVAVPSAVYQGGIMRLGLPVFCAAGLAVLLCVLVPRIRRRAPQALTLCQAVAEEKWARAGLGALSAVAALLSASAAVSMAARMFAYVFSLHYMISLGAASALVLLLTLLCGAQSRRAMDKLQFFLLAALLLGTPAAALLLSGNAQEAMQAFAQSYGQQSRAPMYILCDLCAGLGALGLLLPSQALFAEDNPSVLRRSGTAASAAIAVLMLLAALSGFGGRALGIGLESIPASETVLTQIAELPALPQPVSALLTAALLTSLLLYAQAALHFFGTTVSWDMIQPLTGSQEERPAAQRAQWISWAACLLTFPLAMNANTPLAWYVRDVLLCGSVTGTFLLLRAFGRSPGKRGGRIGLAAGAAVILITWLVPISEKWKILGVVPSMICTALPLLLIKEKSVENKPA